MSDPSSLQESLWCPTDSRHGRNNEATQHTWPDHRPGGHRPNNHPWVSVRSQWTPARNDLKSAPWDGWEISPLWSTTVPQHDLTSAPLAVWGINLLKILHRSSSWVLLVCGASFKLFGTTLQYLRPNLTSSQKLKVVAKPSEMQPNVLPNIQYIQYKSC